MKTFWKKAALILVPLMILAGRATAQGSYTLVSPNKQIEVRIRTGDRIQYDVLFKGTALLQNSTFSIDIDHNTLGVQPRVRETKQRSYDGTLEPPVRQKFAKVRENYNELRLEMEGNYAVVFRAYNEGTAYRFETSLPQTEVKVYGEEIEPSFRRRLHGLLSDGRKLLLAQRKKISSFQVEGDSAVLHRQPARRGGHRERSESGGGRSGY